MKDNRKSTNTRKATRHRDTRNQGSINNESPRKVRPNKRNGKIFNKRFVGFLVFIGILTIIINTLRHPYLKIGQVFVEGNERIQVTDVISKIENPIGKNILFYNTKKQEKKLLENDTIEKAEVTKKFPKVINIKISEIYPEFYIEDDDKITYLSNKVSILEGDKLSNNLKDSLIKINIASASDKGIEEFSQDADYKEFIDKVKKTSYMDSISELNLENKAHIGIIVKDIVVDFGNMDEITYKLGLLESILKDVESKDQDVSSINLTNGKKPIVEINEGS